jgi:hypothetical protein
MWSVGLAIGNTEYIYALHEGSQEQQASTGDAVTQTTSNVMGSLECSNGQLLQPLRGIRGES